MVIKSTIGKLYDKSNDFDFRILNVPYIYSNIDLDLQLLLFKKQSLLFVIQSLLFVRWYKNQLKKFI